MLQAFQDWKRQHALNSYSSQLSDNKAGPLVDFYVNQVLTGMHFPELRKSRHPAKLIEKFFTGTDMLRVGLEFNALTFEIDEALTDQLFEVMKVDAIDESNYVEACQAADLFAQMERQHELFEAFAVFLDEAITDRVVSAGLKVAKMPAKLAGYQRIYRMLSDGLKIAKAAGDPEAVLANIIEHERAVMANIRHRSAIIFFSADSCAA